MDDLNAAKMADVQDWFKTWYGPSNAILVIAGDIKPEEGEGEGREILRRDPAGPAALAAEIMGAAAGREPARDHV